MGLYYVLRKSTRAISNARTRLKRNQIRAASTKVIPSDKQELEDRNLARIIVHCRSPARPQTVSGGEVFDPMLCDTNK
eukprot:scaffold3741_cov113-Chaetoceros_neogracile.AAC.1